MRLVNDSELKMIAGGYSDDNPDPVQGVGPLWNDWADIHGFSNFNSIGGGLFEANKTEEKSTYKEATDFITEMKKSVSAGAKLECKIHLDNKEGKTVYSIDCTIVIEGGLNAPKK